MTFADRGSLTGDTAYAARGVWRLLRNDVRWSDDFELSGVGLIRSFFAQFVRLPFVGVFVVLVARSTGASSSWPDVTLACAFDLLGAMAYLLVAMVEIFFVWRAARAALGADVSAAVLLVVLNIGIDVAADQLSTVVSFG